MPSSRSLELYTRYRQNIFSETKAKKHPLTNPSGPEFGVRPSHVAVDEEHDRRQYSSRSTKVRRVGMWKLWRRGVRLRSKQYDEMGKGCVVCGGGVENIAPTNSILFSVARLGAICFFFFIYIFNSVWAVLYRTL